MAAEPAIWKDCIEMAATEYHRQSTAIVGTRLKGKTGQYPSFTLPYKVRHLFMFLV